MKIRPGPFVSPFSPRQKRKNRIGDGFPGATTADPDRPDNASRVPCAVARHGFSRLSDTGVPALRFGDSAPTPGRPHGFRKQSHPIGTCATRGAC